MKEYKKIARKMRGYIFLLKHRMWNWYFRESRVPLVRSAKRMLYTVARRNGSFCSELNFASGSV